MLILLLLAFLCSCTGGGGETPPSRNEGKVIEEPPEPERDLVQGQVERMTLDEKIGQMLLVGIEGYELNDNTQTLIDKYHVGGIIFYKDNVKDSHQFLELLGALKDANQAQNGPPLWLSLDEEGGRVTRMPSELVKLPPARTIGKADNPEVSQAIGEALGKELSAFGLNMDFAPVLDVNSNPNNPVIGDRSFGTTADLVSRVGVTFMKGLQSQQVASVVKHFPGHGDTSVDSHIDLPVINHDLDRLRSLELKPFGEAINNDADAVMVAHILMSKLDAKDPASFSPAVITDLLRKELGFKGVVITDDLTMGAIVKNYDIGQVGVRAIEAGADVLMVGHGFDAETKVYDAVKNAVENGALDETLIDNSVYRILKLKEKYGITDEKKIQVDPDGLNAELRAALKRLGEQRD
jgi:beta-N-acetylhexosaminidase